MTLRKYAKVVLGLPVEGPFLYTIPNRMSDRIQRGCRILVPFRKKKMVGYVVGFTNKPKVKRLREIESLIDAAPILSKEMLRLTGQLADYYLCSWGEAVQTALPPALRRGRKADG